MGDGGRNKLPKWRLCEMLGLGNVLREADASANAPLEALGRLVVPATWRTRPTTAPGCVGIVARVARSSRPRALFAGPIVKSQDRKRVTSVGEVGAGYSQAAVFRIPYLNSCLGCAIERYGAHHVSNQMTSLSSTGCASS